MSAPANKIFEKYKEDKRIQKEIEKRKKTIEKARLRQQEKIRLAIEKAKNNIITRNERQLARFEKKQRTQAEKKARELLGKKQTKKTLKRSSDSVKYRREKAYKQFQLYARLARSLSNWIIHTWPCQFAHYKITQWWHIYSKHNFPHIAFYLPNCRPISSRENKRQGDSIADRQDSVLDKQEQQALADMAYDITNEHKEKYRTKEYYKEQYEKYKQLNKKELERLWLVGR